jgi:hypothetical protein
MKNMRLNQFAMRKTPNCPRHLVMKKKIRSLIVRAMAFFLVATASAQSTLNINLSNNSGGTAISFYWTGDIVNGGAGSTAFLPMLWHAFGGTFTNYMKSGSGTYSLTTFGSMQNATTSSLLPIGSVDFESAASGSLYFFFTGSQSLTIHPGDMIDYIHGADLATVPMPFSSLNPGIYYQQDVFPPISYNMILTVGNVPEPSVMGLVGLGGLVFCARRAGSLLMKRAADRFQTFDLDAKRQAIIHIVKYL